MANSKLLTMFEARIYILRAKEFVLRGSATERFN